MRKFNLRFDRARLEARLRWSAYRGAGMLGAPGLIAAALLLAALGTELALVRPKLAHQRESLARIAQQRSAYGGIGQPSGNGAGIAGVVQQDADLPRILALIDRHGMAAHEVKYRQIAAAVQPKGGSRSSEPRVAMALPTSGSYTQFHELISGLRAFRGVRAESFTLRRNLPTERMLVIDLNLSLPTPPAASAASAPNAGDGNAYRDLFPEQDRRRDIEAAKPSAPPPPPPKPQAPPLPFRVIGVWTDETQRRIVLSRDGGNDDAVIVCDRCEGAGIGPGERLFGDYRLKKIEPERLTFMYLPLSMKQSIAIEK